MKGNLNILSAIFFVVGVFLLGSNFSEITGMVTTGTGTSNITVDASADITLSVDNVVFLGATINTNNDTTNGDPDPFVVRNDGNVVINVTVASLHNYTFTSAANDAGPGYFEAKCGNNQTTCPAESITSFTPLHTVATKFIASLPFADAGDDVQLEINISVPVNEAPGSKNNTLTFTATDGR